MVAAVEQHLAALNKANDELSKHIKTLEAVVAQENDPKALARDVQAQALAARITILLGRGDVEEALNAYDQLLTLVPNNADVPKPATICSRPGRGWPRWPTSGIAWLTWAPPSKNA